MKIRIKDNSVRFRLTKKEVLQLCTEHSIVSTTSFNSGLLTYSIVVRDNIENLSVDFKDNNIILSFPATEADIWNDSDRITYEHSMVLENGERLKILLEKDFVCLDHSDEDQSDNYANPNKTC